MRSIQKKFGLFTTILIFATASLLTAFALLIFYQNMTAQLKEDVGALSASYSRAVNNQIESFKTGLELSATLEGVTQSDTAARDALLNRLAEKSGFKYFAVADSAGQTSRNSDISKREYFQMAMAGETYMSSPLVNMVDGSVTIMVGTPISNGTGYKGILYGGLPYEAFSKIISDIKIGDGGYAFVTDKNGVIVAHPDTSIVEGMTNYIESAKEDAQYQSIADAIARMITGETGTAYADVDGTQRLYSFTPVAGPEQWSINVSVPMSQIMTLVYNAMLYCFIAAVVLIIISILTALLFSRTMTKPIIAATKRIELLAEGDLHAPVPEAKGRDEIARLNTALTSTIHSLRSYIGEIAMILSAMANDDFTVSAKVDYKGDFVQIKEALNQIVESMSGVLGDINAAAQQVASGSDLVSQSSITLSQGATEQASTVQELSASLEEIAMQTSKNAGNAQSANTLVKSARTNAENGNEKMSDMLGAMEDIDISSGNIKKIIKVIDDIAFQTNILALNAAVEAARAGQHGKGFAVVAEEVRTLAEKSARAASETTELIEGSITKVKAGTKIAKETADMLGVIVEDVVKAANLVDEISQSSEEQSVSVQQIKEGIAQVSNVIQNVAATSQESAAASEELSSQAAQLKEIVGAFRLRKDGSAKGALRLGEKNPSPSGVVKTLKASF